MRTEESEKKSSRGSARAFRGSGAERSATAGRRRVAAAAASKNGTFIGVEADADIGEPTHFDVCQGSNEMAVRDCID
ncbi:hypothetical protein [Mycolicibacterium sp.]|uniref:hypothetical protein n=1 Tax=Mycolicibacterium sp. TaxID=2320850 RepID=UPI0025EF99E9|nr:hypothetical protein [Mycolicibacterium sp.]